MMVQHATKKNKYLININESNCNLTVHNVDKFHALLLDRENIPKQVHGMAIAKNSFLRNSEKVVFSTLTGNLF